MSGTCSMSFPCSSFSGPNKTASLPRKRGEDATPPAYAGGSPKHGRLAKTREARQNAGGSPKRGSVNFYQRKKSPPTQLNGPVRSQRRQIACGVKLERPEPADCGEFALTFRLHQARFGHVQFVEVHRVMDAQDASLFRCACADDGESGVNHFAIRAEMHRHERSFGIAGRQTG